MLLTKKKIGRLKTEMYVMSGIGIVTCVTGTVLGTTSLVKQKKTNEKIGDLERHVVAAEQTATKCCKAMVPIQQAMLSSGLIER